MLIIMGFFFIFLKPDALSKYLDFSFKFTHKNMISDFLKKSDFLKQI